MNSDYGGAFGSLLGGIDLDIGRCGSESRFGARALQREAEGLQVEIVQLVRELLQMLADLGDRPAGDDALGGGFRLCSCRKPARCAGFQPARRRNLG
jgi:hypothetical protein